MKKDVQKELTLTNAGDILPENVTEKLKQAIDRSLERADPNAIRVVSELIRTEEARKHFSNIQIEIVPYRIRDTSLTEIIMKAPDYVIEEVREALVKRLKEAPELLKK